MTEPERRSRKDLPGTEEPSADVLDELLRAFSADQTDTDVLAKIDLTSPEVDRLLGRPSPTAAPVADEEQVDADDADGAGAVDDGVEADVEEPEPPEVADGPDEDIDVADEGEDAEDAGDEIAPRPTIVIADLGAGVPAAEEDFVVAGDPLLGGGPDPVADDDTDGSDGGGRVVSIVDSGLPDAVFLSGDDEGRSRLFIDDRDGLVGAATTISIEDATSATKIEPRLRERRIAVKRAAGRKRLRWVLAITAALAVIVAGLAVLGSGSFAVEDVEVIGAERIDEDALADVVAELEGTPVLLVDTDAAEQQLEAIPWVERARVTTDFPHGATIELVERTPLVTYEAPDGKWRVLDADGRVLAIDAKANAAYLPITGADLTELPLGTFDQRLSAAATLVSALGDLRPEAKSVSISVDSSDLRLVLQDGTEVRFGEAEDLITKLVRLRAKLNELDGDRVRYIDVATAEIGTG